MKTECGPLRSVGSPSVQTLLVTQCDHFHTNTVSQYCVLLCCVLIVSASASMPSRQMTAPGYKVILSPRSLETHTAVQSALTCRTEAKSPPLYLAF